MTSYGKKDWNQEPFIKHHIKILKQPGLDSAPHGGRS